ncbi:unannotated protein [freshwater metagenome]|uniref:Unannotated protein n=1 Tax=freshwater metagenome TaxID=449393 RepID=A0A6J7XRD1_9ZZZZ|nr:DUF2530 domain-containing protein [Actinomycetota bacterium]
MGKELRKVILAITVGTISWFVAGVIALAVGAQAKVIWTCVIGAALGIVGTVYTIRRARKTGI